MDKEKNEYARLKAEANIAVVVDYLGIQKWKRGNAYFILCPFPDHEDSHATNCYYKEDWNNVYCRACGRSMNAIDLIMNTTGASFGEAADLLWELEERPSWYYASRKKKKNADQFHISQEEARLIGLHIPSAVKCPIGISLEKPKEYDPSYCEGYLETHTEYLHWKDFLTPKQYKVIVKNKARETLRKCESAYWKAVSSGNDAFGIAAGILSIEKTCLNIIAR